MGIGADRRYALTVVFTNRLPLASRLLPFAFHLTPYVSHPRRASPPASRPFASGLTPPAFRLRLCQLWHTIAQRKLEPVWSELNEAGSLRGVVKG